MKPETRNPKAEGRPKSEARNLNRYEQRRREDGTKRMKAEIGKAESRNPKARAFHSASSYFCFLLSTFLLSSSRLRVFAVSLVQRRPLEFPFGLRFSAFLRPSVFGLRISSAASGASLVLIAVVAALAGCAVGPNYQRPPALGTNAMPAAFSGAGATNTGVW